MVAIYTTKTCSYCPMVKKYLRLKGVDYIEKDAEDPEVAKEAHRLSGALTVPITVIGERVVVGYNLLRLSDAIKAL